LTLILYLLKAKQQKRLAGWAPAEDYIPNATVVNQVSPRNVTQTLVSDCSFVSAMILSAGYENKFHTQIITNSLFPQNRERKPVLNPYGKYCVRLHINGCWRLVEVDTRFPFDQNGRLLTSYSKDKAELWVRTGVILSPEIVEWKRSKDSSKMIILIHVTACLKKHISKLWADMTFLVQIRASISTRLLGNL